MDRKNKIAGFAFFCVLVAAVFFLKIDKHRPFNVILITCDALRPDHLGSYGYKLNTSPNIDKFSKEATLFTQAITQGSKTPLALPSLLTSTYARTHGCYREGYKISLAVPMLAEILKKNNYATAAIVDSIKHIRGLERGFDTFTDYQVKRADETTRRAIAWLENNYNHKFFLWLHYFDTHGPYRPPAPYNSMFIDKLQLNRRYVPICSRMYSCDKGIPFSVAENNITDPDYYISQYDGEIRFADEQIGMLFKKIKKLGLDTNTIIVFTADHGELLGEHEIYFEHSTLYDQTLRVPLLIKCEKIIPPSKIIEQQVQLIDIAPTILALLHIPKDKHMQGKNLLPLILGARDNHSTYAFSERARPEIESVKECIRTKEWKLVYNNSFGLEKYELYNLKRDPVESSNLINTEKKEFEILKRNLDNWHKQTPICKPEPFPLTDGDKEGLRNLGYLQ